MVEFGRDPSRLVVVGRPSIERGIKADPQQIRLRLGVPVGPSDHTLSIAVPVASATLRARLVEEYFTLDRFVPGPDNAFSLEPEESRAMLKAVRTAERAIGTVRYFPTNLERACISSLSIRRRGHAEGPVI